MQRTKYAAEFKSQAVKQVIDKDHPVIDVPQGWRRSRFWLT